MKKNITKKSVSSFLLSLKNVIKDIPFTETDNPSKRIIALAIKESGVSNIKDVLDYIVDICEIPVSQTEKEWKHILDYHKNWNGVLGKMLRNVEKKFKKVSEEQFATIATACDMDSATLLAENKIDEFGWVKVLDVLKEVCQTMGEVTKTEQNIEAHLIPTTCSKEKWVMKNESGEIVAKFKTALEAAAATGICRSSISKSLTKKYPRYEWLKSPKDGNYYTFDYLETCETVAAKKPTRQYNRDKIVIVDIKSGVPTTYNSAKEAATATGMKYDQIVYRAKSTNHVLGTFEVWYEKDYMANMSMAA